jgi:hypothetical protein
MVLAGADLVCRGADEERETLRDTEVFPCPLISLDLWASAKLSIPAMRIMRNAILNVIFIC